MSGTWNWRFEIKTREVVGLTKFNILINGFVYRDPFTSEALSGEKSEIQKIILMMSSQGLIKKGEKVTIQEAR